MKSRRKSVPAEIAQEMVAVRRALHRHPEVSGEERWTAEFLGAKIEALGLTCRRGVGGHGLVVDLPGKKAGPFIALRADMDALPMSEETSLSFASEQPGAMHACGHDGHSAALFGVLLLLRRGEAPALPVRFLWQPAEETARGAAAMIRADALRHVAMIFGGHIDGRYSVGEIVVTPGSVNASVDQLAFRIQGQ